MVCMGRRERDLMKGLDWRLPQDDEFPLDENEMEEDEDGEEREMDIEKKARKLDERRRKEAEEDALYVATLSACRSSSFT